VHRSAGVHTGSTPASQHSFTKGTQPSAAANGSFPASVMHALAHSPLRLPVKSAHAGGARSRASGAAPVDGAPLRLLLAPVAPLLPQHLLARPRRAKRVGLGLGRPRRLRLGRRLGRLGRRRRARRRARLRDQARRARAPVAPFPVIFGDTNPASASRGACTAQATQLALHARPARPAASTGAGPAEHSQTPRAAGAPSARALAACAWPG